MLGIFRRLAASALGQSTVRHLLMQTEPRNTKAPSTSHVHGSLITKATCSQHERGIFRSVKDGVATPRPSPHKEITVKIRLDRRPGQAAHTTPSSHHEPA